jgi:uncharacterized protein involved in outer membrane biogenesis
MNKWKKILFFTGAALLLLVTALLLSLGTIIKTGVTTVGPRLVGVPIQLEKVRINLFNGRVHVKGLVVGNPEGFKTPSAMELSDFMVDLKMTSLFSDTIVVEQVLIRGPQITFEKSLKSSNFGALQQTLAAKAPAADRSAEAPAKATSEQSGAAKKVIIEDFRFDDGKVHISITAMGGKKMTVPLQPIRLQNIGQSSGGASLAQVIQEVLNTILRAVTETVSSAGDFAGDVLKDPGAAAGDAAKSASDAAKGAADSIKNGVGGLFGK